MTTGKPVALVTGASSGIGKAAALALVDGVTFLDLDVTSDESVSTAVGRVIERFGRLDVLVNNAGTGAAGAAEESSVAQDQRVFDINFFGLVRMTKAVLPHMRAQGRGRIINISSVLGLEPAYTRPGFAENALNPDAPLPIYAEQRQAFDRVMASAMEGGDDPATVAKSIVAAATDPKPKLRYTAGSTAGRVSALRRFVPAWAFDRQIRKLNRLPA